MTKTSLLITCVLGLALVLPAVAAPDGRPGRSGRASWTARQRLKGALPDAWFIAGNNKREYEGGTALELLYAGKPSGYIRSVGFNMQGYGSLVSVQDATPFQGKRVRVSAMLKSMGVQQWAGLWAGLDSEEAPFDPDHAEAQRRMKILHEKPLMGTMDWRSASLEIDVPTDTEQLLFGLAMMGRGVAYINRVRVDVVTPQAVPSPSLDF